MYEQSVSKVWSVKAQSKTGALLGWFHAFPGGRGPWKGVDVRQITVRRRGIRRGWVESELRHIEPHGGRRPVARVLWATLKVPGADEVCVRANCFGNPVVLFQRIHGSDQLGPLCDQV